MKNTLIVLIGLLLLLGGCGGGSDRNLSTALSFITAEDMHTHMFFLASDSLRGRDTPSPELDTAAEYISEVFLRCGLLPLHGSYFQQVSLNVVDLGDQNGLKIVKGGVGTSYEIKTDFTPFDMTANRTVSAPLVFAGYGITAPEYQYDDYAPIDAKGKIVVVLRHEPREDDSSSVFMGRTATDYSNVPRKVAIAKDHGAVAVFVITDPLNHTSLAPRGFPWPSLSRTLPKDALPVTLAADEDSKIPVIHIGESAVNLLFGSVEALKALQMRIDSTLVPQSFDIGGTNAWVQTATKITMMSTNNVVGFLEGSDPVMKNQIVVVGAHYDHVGYKKQHAEGEDYIYNGADDNASGACALMGVAAGLAALQERPKRSILLIAFAGEEKGLFGSEFYLRHPFFPVDSTVAMLNMDMVGRNGEDSLFLIGAGSSPDLAEIAREEDARVGFVLTNEVLSSGGSDHTSFQKRNIPSLFFHSGLHPQYHQVSDSPHLINLRKLTNVARLAFLTAVRVANDIHRYRYIPKPITLF